MIDNLKHWFTLDTWTFEDAACLFAGVTPSSDSFDEHEKPLSSASPRIREKMERYSYLINADWSDIDPDASKNKKTTIGNYIFLVLKNNMDIEVSMAEEMRKYLLKTNPEKVSELYDAANTDQSIKHSVTADEESNNAQDTTITKEPGLTYNHNQHFDDALIEAFNSLPVSSIAGIFRLSSDETKNLKQWKSYSSKASENGLINYRDFKGIGSKESEYNPVKIANWLIEKGHLPPERTSRILKKNIPDRSRDKLEFLFPD